MGLAAHVGVRGFRKDQRGMPLRVLVLALLVAGALLAATPASARVGLVYVTSPAPVGSIATLIAAVPAKATCSVTVTYKNGPSRARGLVTKRASGGRVSWTWLVGSRTPPGRWPIVVSCGSAGTLRTSFIVAAST
jgi:hypothetical protein